MKTWNKLIPPRSSADTTSNSPDDEAPSNETFVQLFNDLGYEKGQGWQAPDTWIAEDANNPGYQLMTDSEIVADILSQPENQDCDTDDETEIQPLITDGEACTAFETGLKWLEAQEGTDPISLLLIKRWRDTAV